MKFQVIKPFSVTVKGRTTRYTLGQRIGETRYNKLPQRIQETYFLSARSACRKVPYTRPELTQIVNLYLENDDVYSVRARFCELNPNTGHTAESIRAVAGQLRSMDNNHPGDTEWAVKSLVAEVAMGIDPERFTSATFDEKLDSILADIRA